MHRTTRGALALGLVGAVTTLAPSATAATADVTPQVTAEVTAGTIVGLWHMDERPGATTMVDASGFGHDGAIGNVTLGAPGFDSSTAYDFGGSALVRVPHRADLNPGTQPITMSIWMRVPANLTTGDYNLLQKGTATTPGGNYKVEIFGKSGSRFGFPDCVFNGARGSNRIYGPRSVADGQWHHVVCSLTTTQALITVDGQPGQTAARQVSTISNTMDLTIGGKPNNTHYYRGIADEAVITIG